LNGGERNLEADRRQLVSRLFDTQLAFAKARTAPLILREDALLAAFDAVACVGHWNRQHQNMRIEPIAPGSG
jgi:hypothetical protein